MKFEVLSDKGKTVFQCRQLSCVPNKDEIDSMIGCGYKIRIDGKIATKKMISEFLRGIND